MRQWLFRLAAGISLAAALSSSVAHAQVCTDPRNLVPAAACGFSTSLGSWWSTSYGSWAFQAADGHDSPGSAQGTSGNMSGVQSVDLYSPCLTLSPTTTYAFGAFLKFVSGALPTSFTMYLVEYPNATCTPPTVGPPAVMAPSATGWNKVSGTQTTGSGDRSGVLVLQVSRTDSSSFVVRVDDLFLGPDLAPVELVGFSVE